MNVEKRKSVRTLFIGWVVGITVTIVSLVAYEATAADLSARPPESLQQEWNDMMLAGQFGWIYNGQFNRMGPENASIDPHASFPDKAEGWIDDYLMTVWTIRVSSLKEQRYLLMGRGGWVLTGGLLRRVDTADGRLELYGKTITRHEPYWNPWPHVYFNNESWHLGHELFLIRRSSDQDKAMVLRKWVIGDAYGTMGMMPRGYLEYDKFSQTATVRVTNGHFHGLRIDHVDLKDRASTTGPSVETWQTKHNVNVHDTLLTLLNIPKNGMPESTLHLTEHHGFTSFEAAEGWVNQALRSKESIRAEAEMETERGGYKQSVWVCLALVRRESAGAGQILELYARKWNCGGTKPSYDYFLLLRPQPQEKATLLRQWNVPPDGPGKLLQRAFLDYARDSNTVQVRVTDGLEPPNGWTLIQDTIPISLPQ